MEECCICFEDNNIDVLLKCNHNLCILCFYKVKKCPICRNEKILKKFDLIKLSNLLINLDIKKLNPVYEQIKKLFWNDIYKLHKILCDNLEANYFPLNFNNYLLLLKNIRFSPKMYDELNISYFNSNENFIFKYNDDHYNLDYISDISNSCELVNELGIMNLLQSKINQINNTIISNLNIKYFKICPFNTKIFLNDDYQMNLIQYHFHKYNEINLNKVCSFNLLMKISKSIYTYYYCLNNNIKDMYQQFHNLIINANNVVEIMDIRRIIELNCQVFKDFLEKINKIFELTKLKKMIHINNNNIYEICENNNLIYDYLESGFYGIQKIDRVYILTDKDNYKFKELVTNN